MTCFQAFTAEAGGDKARYVILHKIGVRKREICESVIVTKYKMRSEGMKKGIIALSVVLIGLVGFVVFIQNVNLNRIGAEQYYVQINQDGKRVEDSRKYVSYEYTLGGFDSNGKEKNLTFKAFKELRKEAYLRIYVQRGGVSSYQEVKVSELPELAKQKLAAVQQ